LIRALQTARAFVFAAEEDFGIVAVEAQGEGVPVIALGRGGTREIVVTDGPARTGMFFPNATAADIVAAIRGFLVHEQDFSPLDCHANARRFAEAEFELEFCAFVDEQIALFNERLERGRTSAGQRRQSGHSSGHVSG
jgi:glycosyltransferase involved in cell wall biosynthesis